MIGDVRGGRSEGRSDEEMKGSLRGSYRHLGRFQASHPSEVIFLTGHDSLSVDRDGFKAMFPNWVFTFVS